MGIVWFLADKMDPFHLGFELFFVDDAVIHEIGIGEIFAVIEIRIG
jgi:hypothetical protein